MAQRLRILLLDTSPRGSLGSMTRYGDLVERCLSSANHASSFDVKRVRLALPHAALRRVPGRLRSLAHHGWVWMSARIRLARTRSDLTHVLDGSHAYVVTPFGRASTVVTSHDVIPLKQLHGEFGPERPGWLARRVIEASIRGLSRTVHIITDSDSTRRDLARLTAQKAQQISVIQIPVDPDLGESGGSGADDDSVHGFLHRPFILHVGNDAFYKNRAGVVNIFARVRRGADAHLVMAGAPPSEQLQGLVHELGLDDCVHFLSKVDDRVISRCYESAAMLLFPSIYEGYGWPPLEAMAHDCPVVCSNAASLPEVVGDAALMAAPDDEGQLAEHCLAVLKNPGLAESMVIKGQQRLEHFTLEKMANEISEVYRKVLGQKAGEDWRAAGDETVRTSGQDGEVPGN